MPRITGLTTLQKSRHLSKKNMPLISTMKAPTAKKKFSPTPKYQPSDMFRDIKRRHASDTTNTAMLASLRASDPQGMIRYNNNRKFRSKTSVEIMDAKYKRGLYTPV